MSRRAIELLDNPNGFFIMAEGGKIDWACHANDAAASIHDTLAFDEAIAKAVKFYEKRPQETLIIVTGDHETGGMAIGFAGTQYSSFVDKIQRQKMSYIEFNKRTGNNTRRLTHVADAKLEDILPLIKEAFGLYVMPARRRRPWKKLSRMGEAEDVSTLRKRPQRTLGRELGTAWL